MYRLQFKNVYFLLTLNIIYHYIIVLNHISTPKMGHLMQQSWEMSALFPTTCDSLT